MMKVRSWKKSLLLGSSVLLVAIGVCFAIYWSSWKKNPDAEIIDLKIIPETIHIGEIIQIGIITELPWYRRPEGPIKLNVTDGLQIIDASERSWTGLRLGKWTWRSILKLQAYDFGPFSDLEVKLPITADRHKKHDILTASLPDIIVESRLDDTSADLLMAPELSAEFLRQQNSKRQNWLYIAVTVSVLAAVLYFLFRSRPQKKKEAPKPWTVAESLLFGLEDRLPLDAETVFVELTDIIRRYIESVYNLPATERTTPEFLMEIERNRSQLSADNSLLLRDFLTAADMVKFARLDATQNQILDAIKKAKRFIVETSETIVKAQSVENK